MIEQLGFNTFLTGSFGWPGSALALDQARSRKWLTGVPLPWGQALGQERCWEMKSQQLVLWASAAAGDWLAESVLL